MAPTARHSRILVIDDDQDILELVSRILSRQGYAPFCAADGEQGLQLFKTEKPPIVLNMPGDELALESKIISVADVIEAMSSHRPYRPALDMPAAKAEIVSKRGNFYCPECVDACIELIETHNDDSKNLFGSLERQEP